MNQVIDIFKEITTIPRCSRNQEPMKNYIIDYAKKYNYDVQTDAIGNVLISSKNPKIALQAHYDMVCVGDFEPINVYEEDGWLKAQNSSLGADNGIAIAYMFALMQEGYEIEALLTCDEEIGLIGANNLELKPKSKRILNLDSEEEGDVFIGCAGGVDVITTKVLKRAVTDFEYKIYEVSIKDLPGGHSGCDIHREIPNAIQELAKALHGNIDYLLDIKGGNRRNAIPSSAIATVAVHEEKAFFIDEPFEVRVVDPIEPKYIEDGLGLLELLIKAPHGVMEENSELGIPQTSINLALLETQENYIKISLTARSMQRDDLQGIEDKTHAYFKDAGFNAQSEGKYYPWTPTTDAFSELILNEYKKVNEHATYKAIHAGLECAVLKEKLPDIQVCSIGPNIIYPHSTREMCEIASVERVYEVVKNIIDNL